MKQAASETSSLHHGFILVALIAAGEAVFLLPFVLARVFRPTFLDAVSYTHLTLPTKA